MDPELLNQFRHRLLPFDSGQRHLGLKRRSVIPSCSLHCLAPLTRPPRGGLGEARLPLNHTVRISGALSPQLSISS